MVPETIRPSVAAELDRHERRREEGVPCVSVLVGIPALALGAVRQWSEERNRTLIQARGPGLDAMAEAWVAELTERRDLVRDAVSWLARASDRPREDLAGWVARASLFDIERFLETTSPGEPADVCRWILKAPTASGEVSPERVLAALAVMNPQGSAPVYLAAVEKPGCLDAVISALARLAEAAPLLSMVLAVEPVAFERYLREAPESRAKVLLRGGVIHVPARTEPVVLEGRAEDTSERPVDLDVAAARAFETGDDEPARSAAERFLYDRLESLAETSGLFQINAELDIPFGTGRAMEVDLWAGKLGLAIEIDGYYHFQSRDAYRRDRRKDLALQKRGHLVVRVLAEDVVERLEAVLDLILEAVTVCRDLKNPARGETP